MIRNVKFIWYGMSYTEMKTILKDNRTLSSFPLVENPSSMILLGSIHRQHLIKVCYELLNLKHRLLLIQYYYANYD